jgi:hypothetical protein
MSKSIAMTGAALLLLAYSTVHASAQEGRSDEQEASVMCVLAILVESYAVAKICDLPVDDLQTQRYLRLRRALETHITENSDQKDIARLTKGLEERVSQQRGDPRLCTETARFSHDLLQRLTSDEGQRTIIESLRPGDPFKGTCL